MLDRILHAALALAPSRPELAMFALLLATMLIMMIWERRRPAYRVDHRATWKRDVSAAVVCATVIVPAAGYVSRYLSFTPVLPRAVFALPFAFRFFMFVVIGDFGFYWVHRAMHSKYLWPVHRWHHSPSHMYWLVGARGSFIQQILVNAPYFFAQALFAVSPWWTGLAITFKNTLQANWMHMNVRWGARWIEWFIVTPRYHHIHHSDNPDYYNANVAAIFPIWDRLFGTYRDPDTAPAHLDFGTKEKTPRWRLALGV